MFDREHQGTDSPLIEAVWRRSRPYIELSKQQAAPLLEAAIGRTDVVALHLLEGGKSNTNYAVRFSDGLRVVLRIYERDRRACAVERAAICCVGDSVPVAPFLGSIEKPGDVLGDAEAHRLGSHPVAVYRWVDGTSPLQICSEGDEDTVRTIFRRIGQTLAAIGSSREFDAPGLLDANLELRTKFFSNREAFRDFVEWSLTEGGAGRRLGDALTRAVDGYATKQAHLLDATEGNYRLTHGDFKFSNLLVRPRGRGWEICAVLDWEFLRSSTPLFDVAVFLRQARHFSSRALSAFAVGFRDRGGVLPERWRRVAALYELQHLCGFLNGSGAHPPMANRVKSLIEDIVTFESCD